MKTLTVRLPESLVANIEKESRARSVSKSDVVRERLLSPVHAGSNGPTMFDLVADLIHAAPELPADLSANKKKYLPDLIRGKKLHR